jgi:hypothetical protein
LDATGPGSPAAATRLVVAMIRALIRRKFGVIGPVDHQTSQPLCGAGDSTRRAIHDNK